MKIVKINKKTAIILGAENPETLMAFEGREHGRTKLIFNQPINGIYSHLFIDGEIETVDIFPVEIVVDILDSASVIVYSNDENASVKVTNGYHEDYNEVIEDASSRLYEL